MNPDTSRPLRLYLIRYGETEWSLSGWHTGRTNNPLTANGEDEVRELGKRLRNIPFDHVLTSPLKRALQTCALVRLEKAPENEPDLAGKGMEEIGALFVHGGKVGAEGYRR